MTLISVVKIGVKCTPRYSTGVKDAVVKDEPGGNVLLDFTVTVY